MRRFLQRILDWLRNHKHTSQEAVIEYHYPILRGFGNYYKHSASKRVFSYIDDQIWRTLWRWCFLRHPGKGKEWIARKYYRTIHGRKWTFSAEAQDRRGKKETIAIFRLSSIPVERHVKVKGTASPNDPLLTKYWKDRQTTQGKTYWAKGSKYYEVAERQKWKCTVCGEHLFNGEELHTHHMIRVKDERPLGIPTVRDRIEQVIVKNALLPEWEAVFEQNSYGLRPGRSCQDAVEQRKFQPALKMAQLGSRS